jgi:tetratricopeptide (TPR) repeat protein
MIGLLPGRWSLRVEAEGFLPGEGVVVVPVEGAPEEIEVRLRGLDEAPPAVAENDPAATARRWIERGNALLEQGQPAEARAEYVRALDLLPAAEQAQVLQGVARTHFVEGDAEAAAEALERALRLAPTDSDLRQLYTTLQDGRGRGQEAADFLAGLVEESADEAAAPPAAANGASSDAAEELPPEIAARLAAPPKPADAGMTGHHEVTFGESSPLGSLDVFVARFASNTDEAGRSLAADDAYELADESFHLYVPAVEAPRDGWGLIVWIAPIDWGGFQREGLAEVLDRHRLVWVGANRSGNARPVRDRWRLALDAAAGAMELLAVDPRRVYVAGYSGGGRIASHLGPAFPEPFRGTLCWFGADHFHPVPVPDRPGSSWPPSVSEPPAEILDTARRDSRFLLVSGERDFNRAQTVAIAEHLREDGFQHVELIVIPDADHYIGLDPEWLDRALTALDGSTH